MYNYKFCVKKGGVNVTHIGITAGFKANIMLGYAYDIDVYDEKTKEFGRSVMISSENDGWIGDGRPVNCTIASTPNFGHFESANENDPAIQEMMAAYRARS